MNIRHIFAITRYSLIQELRWKRSTAKKPSYRMLVSLLVMYLFAGFAVGTVLVRIASPFAESLIASTFFMVLALNFVIVEFPTLVTGPEDYSYYVSFPVLPLSYFLGKVLSILVLIAGFGTAFSIPIAAYHIAYRGLDAGLFWTVLSILVSGITMVFLVINLIGIIVRFVNLKYVRTVSSMFQILLVFAVYGLFFFFSRNISQYAAFFSFGWDPSLIFLPSAWISAVFDLGADASAVAAFILAFLAIPALVVLSSRIISFEFGSRITELESKTLIKKSGGKTRFSILWKTDEEKAVSMLLKNHLKFDQQFRMAILMIIPLSAVYFVLVLVNSVSGIRDPFTPEGVAQFTSTIPLYVAIGFFPFYIKNAVSFSSCAEASWIFYVSPFDKVKLIDGLRKFIHVFFLLPYFAIFLGIYIFIAKSVIGILLHFLVVFLLTMIQADLFLYFFASIPFSKKYQKGKGMFAMYFRMLLALFLPVTLTLFVYFLYFDSIRFAILVVALVGVMFFVRILGRKRAAKRLEREEYGYGA